MRFKAKIDYASLVYWFLFGPYMVYMLWPPKIFDAVRTSFQSDTNRIPHEILGVLTILILIALPLAWVLSFFKSFPRYCEVLEDGLFLRQGWKRSLIQFATIDQILPLAAAIRFLPPSNRILIMPVKGNTFTIAVAEKERFLDELSKKCPQLEQRETKYGLSLQRAIL